MDKDDSSIVLEIRSILTEKRGVHTEKNGSASSAIFVLLKIVLYSQQYDSLLQQYHYYRSKFYVVVITKKIR